MSEWTNGQTSNEWFVPYFEIFDLMLTFSIIRSNSWLCGNKHEIDCSKYRFNILRSNQLISDLSCDHQSYSIFDNEMKFNWFGTSNNERDLIGLPEKDITFRFMLFISGAVELEFLIFICQHFNTEVLWLIKNPEYPSKC